MSAPLSTELYEFEDVTVDLRRVEVRRAGELVPLEPKSFDVLRYLLEHRDRLVTKDELLDAVWKDTFVTPNVLTRAVAQLRKALGDDAFEARFIETVAKRGYRFIAPVGARDDGGGPAPGPVSPRSVAVPTVEGRYARRRLLTWVVAGLVVAGMAAAMMTWRGGRNRPAASGEPPVLAPQRLTAARESYAYPAISPDGSAIAYVSKRTGSDEIYVAGLAPGSRELPITSDGAHNGEPAFSPDGQWLAYRAAKTGGIWVVPATGGVARRVAEFGSRPAWSPDSQTIVFSSRGGLSSQAALWTVRRDGSSLVQLTQLGSPVGGHAAPAWSNDGRLIAFMVGRHEEREIWAMPASGGVAWRLAALTRFSEPSFAPDDRALYFLGTTAEQNDCLMRVTLTSEGKAAAEPQRIFTFQGAGVEKLTIARNGTAVFLWNRRSVNLFAVDLDPAGDAGGPAGQLTFDEDAISRYAQYGRDTRVAFEQVVAGRPITAWVMDDDGRNPVPLSAGLSASVRTPQWDAGARRVFTLVEPSADQEPHFAWIDLATRQLTRIALSPSGRANMPSLSPDGRQLAFHLIDADGIVNVWVQPLDGGAARQVTFDREAISYPRWSRDGAWLVVAIKRGEDTHLGVVSARGGPVEQLTAGRGVLFGYSFSPDGDRIAFARMQGEGDATLYTVSRRTREMKQILAGARWPAFSPRGNRIVFSRAERTASLWRLRLSS